VIYLSGCVTQSLLALPRDDVGVMFQPGMGNDTKPLMFRRWAADNGCFAQGERFDAGDWIEWLASLRRFRSTCLFAVAPDVMGDWQATWERSSAFLPTIRQLGFRAALVAQNGMPLRLLDLAGFDALFVGGTNEWRDQTNEPQRLIAKAQRRGKWTHWGRVNTDWAIDRAWKSGCDSADGTFLAYGPDRNLRQLLGWLDGTQAPWQGQLLGAI
jgi:hypothetical protein